MRLIHRDRIEEFVRKHPDARSSLGAWTQIMERIDFDHFPHLRRTFPSADYVRPWTVFNISGNKYRLIAVMNYALEVVDIRKVLTHAEYDRGRWR